MPTLEDLGPRSARNPESELPTDTCTRRSFAKSMPKEGAREVGSAALFM